MRMKLIGLLVMLAMVLVACGEDEEGGAKDLPPLNLSPEAGSMVSGCETDDLETWYENASDNLRTFRDEARRFAVVDREEVRSRIERLAALRDQIVTVPVPECMTETHSAAVEIVNTVVDRYSDYYSGSIDQEALEARVQEQLNRYDTEILPLLDAAQVQLEQRFGE